MEKDACEGALIELNSTGISLLVPLVPLPKSPASPENFPPSSCDGRNPFDSVFEEALGLNDPFELPRNKCVVESDQTCVNVDDGCSIKVPMNLPISNFDLLSNIPEICSLQTIINKDGTHKSDEKVLVGPFHTPSHIRDYALAACRDTQSPSDGSRSERLRTVVSKQPQLSEKCYVDRDQNNAPSAQINRGRLKFKLDLFAAMKSQQENTETSEARSIHSGMNANDLQLEEVKRCSEVVKRESSSQNMPSCSKCEKADSDMCLVRAAVSESIGQCIKKAQQISSIGYRQIMERPFQFMQPHSFLQSRVDWRNEYGKPVLEQSGFSSFNQGHFPLGKKSLYQRQSPSTCKSHQVFPPKSNFSKLNLNHLFTDPNLSSHQAKTFPRISREFLEEMSVEVSFDSAYQSNSQIESDLSSICASSCVPPGIKALASVTRSSSKSNSDSQQKKSTGNSNCYEVPKNEDDTFKNDLEEDTEFSKKRSLSPLGSPIASSSPRTSLDLPSSRKRSLEDNSLDLHTTQGELRSKSPSLVQETRTRQSTLPRKILKLDLNTSQGKSQRKPSLTEPEKRPQSRPTKILPSGNKSLLQPTKSHLAPKGLKAVLQKSTGEKKTKKSVPVQNKTYVKGYKKK